MTWYPEWVVALEDIRTSTTPVEMTPRIAELIVAAIQKQSEDLGRARTRINELEQELQMRRLTRFGETTGAIARSFQNLQHINHEMGASLERLTAALQQEPTQ